MSEERFLLSLHAAASPTLDVLFLVSHWMGSLWASAVLVLALSAWHRVSGARRTALVWLVAGISVLVVEESLKAWVARPRPYLWATLVRPRDFSFPSGHAMASAAFYPLLAVTLARRGVAGLGPLLAVGVAIAAFIGFGRLYLGVHWPSDVLAGWAVGGTVALIAARSLGPSVSSNRAAEGSSSGVEVLPPG